MKIKFTSCSFNSAKKRQRKKKKEEEKENPLTALLDY